MLLAQSTLISLWVSTGTNITKTIPIFHSFENTFFLETDKPSKHAFSILIIKYKCLAICLCFPSIPFKNTSQ